VGGDRVFQEVESSWDAGQLIAASITFVTLQVVVLTAYA